MDELVAELRTLVADALMLDEVPEALDAEADLFATLGIDSIEALEVAMAVRRRYGVQLDAKDDRNHEIFKSLGTLASFVRSNRTDA